MLLVKRSGWPNGSTLLSDLFDDMRLFNSTLLGGRKVLPVKVRENKKNYNNNTDFNVSIDSGLLTVSADRRKENGDNYTGREFGFSAAFI